MNKIILAWGLSAAGALACAHALAQVSGMDRQFPPAASYCKATKHALPAEAKIALDGKIVGLSPALVIRDANNRIVVNSYLPQQFEGMCIFGIGGALEKVWIMSPEQGARVRAARAAAASPNRSAS